MFILHHIQITAFLYFFSGSTGILIYLPYFSILDLDKYTFNIVLMCNSSLHLCVFVDRFYQRRTAKYRDSYNTGGFFYINTSNCFLQCYSDLQSCMNYNTNLLQIDQPPFPFEDKEWRMSLEIPSSKLSCMCQLTSFYSLKENNVGKN